MKTFARSRTSQEFIKAAKDAGLEVDTAKFDEGGDHIVFSGELHGAKVRALFSVVNGRVFGEHDGVKFDTDDLLDGQPWFDAVLDLANTNEPRKAA